MAFGLRPFFDVTAVRAIATPPHRDPWGAALTVLWLAVLLQYPASMPPTKGYQRFLSPEEAAQEHGALMPRRKKAQ